MPRATLKDERPPLGHRDRPASRHARTLHFEPATRDLVRLLGDWRGDDLAARLVHGDDGRPKMQVRFEQGLGLIQLEADGPPHPDQVETVLSRARRRIGQPLTDADTADLDREGRLIARRYLGWFLLGRWNRVIRDANHHLAAIDLIRRLAPAGHRDAAERWLPYAVMMRARARSARSVAEGDAAGAIETLRKARLRIDRFRTRSRKPYLGQQEAAILDDVAMRLRATLARDHEPAKRLAGLIRRAVRREDFERAAALRDRLNDLRPMPG